MLVGVLNVAGGLVVGLLTGYFYERRATNAARLHGKKLASDLAELRHAVLSVGGTEPIRSAVAIDGAFPDLVRKRAVQTQNSEGRVQTGTLIAYFLAHGHPRDHIDSAVAELVTSGALVNHGAWLELR